MGRPKAEAHGEGLPDAHGHTAPSAPAPAKAQCDADQDHDYRDKGEGNSAVIVCLQPRSLGSLLLSAPRIGPNVVEGHQLGIAAQPCGEVVRYQGERDGPAVEQGGRYCAIWRKLSVLSLKEGPGGIAVAGFGCVGHAGQLEVTIELEESHGA